MPGLRSLVARRRCSLPSTHIVSNESLFCSYPTIPASISRKRNSLDEINQRENIIKEDVESEKHKWDLKTLFEIKDEPIETPNSDNLNQEVFNCHSNLSASINGNINISGKENDSSISTCSQTFHDTKEISTVSDIKQEPSSPIVIGEESNKSDSNEMSIQTKVSPERIVIKMKLLHGNSLSDVTNLAPDSSEGSEILERSDPSCESGTLKIKTRWTIDSILNQPVNSSPTASEHNENFFKENSHPIVSNSTNIDNEEKTKNIDHENIDHELNSFIKTQNFNGTDLKPQINSTPLKKQYTSPYPVLSNASLNPTLKFCNDDNNLSGDSHPTINYKGMSRFNDNVRRASASSDISEDSICSEASTVSCHSNSSSDSSVKSCSIVLKRLENSDNYSCFRSPKNKRKKFQEVGLSRAVYVNQNSSVPVLYIPKRLLYKSNSNILPCSVTLCDIFSNYPFRKELCPRCFNIYNLSSDLFVDTYSSTITLQCVVCKWLVVRSLKSKEIDLRIDEKNGCA